MSSIRRATARLPCPDLTEALQARLLSDLNEETAAARDRGRAQIWEDQIAALEAALATADALSKQRQQKAEIATNRVGDLEAHVVTLEAALANAEVVSKQWQQEAELSAKRADAVVAEIFKVTSELVEMSKRMAEQTTLADKARAELDDYRSRSWWWQHGIG
jgi:chemotaxis protein MotB